MALRSLAAHRDDRVAGTAAGSALHHHVARHELQMEEARACWFTARWDMHMTKSQRQVRVRAALSRSRVGAAHLEVLRVACAGVHQQWHGVRARLIHLLRNCRANVRGLRKQALSPAGRAILD